MTTVTWANAADFFMGTVACALFMTGNTGASILAAAAAIGIIALREARS